MRASCMRERARRVDGWIVLFHFVSPIRGRIKVIQAGCTYSRFSFLLFRKWEIVGRRDWRDMMDKNYRIGHGQRETGVKKALSAIPVRSGHATGTSVVVPLREMGKERC